MIVFREVARQGSFTAAAEQLGHTKSGISSYISQLEQTLGLKLLNRSTRRLNLTPAGQQFLHRCEQLVTTVERAVTELEGFDREPQGRIAITAPHAFEEPLLTPLVAQLCQRFPKLEPELIFTDQRLDLLQHNLDLAITVGEPRESRYNMIPLGHLDSVLTCSPEYIARNTKTDIGDLTSHTLIQLPWQSRNPLISEQGNASYHSDHIIRVNTSTAAINAARNHMGLLLVPEIFIADQIRKGELIQVMPQWQGERRKVSALHSYGQSLPVALRTLVDQLKEQFSQAQEK